MTQPERSSQFPRLIERLSRRTLVETIARGSVLLGLKETLVASEAGVKYVMLQQSTALNLPLDRLNIEVDGLPRALRPNQTELVIPKACFGDLLKPAQAWDAPSKNAQEFGSKLGTFCAKNSEHEVMNKLDAGVKSAKCVLELLKRVVAEEVAFEILEPLGGAVNLVLLVVVIQEYRNYQIDKRIYKAAVDLADRISSTTKRDPKSTLFRSYYLSDDQDLLWEKLFFQGSDWTEPHPLWTASYRRA